MVKKKLVNVGNPTSKKDGVNESYAYTNFLKLSGGTVTGHIILSNLIITSHNQALNHNIGNVFFIQF